jgi:hypothetical protein
LEFGLVAPPLGAGEVERKLMLRVVLKLFLFLMRDERRFSLCDYMPTTRCRRF